MASTLYFFSISTSFTPTEKLSQIQLTFGDITKVVEHHLMVWVSFTVSYDIR